MDWPNLTPGPIPPFLFYVSNKFAETAFNQSFQFYANFQVKLFVLLLHFASVILKFCSYFNFLFHFFFWKNIFFFQFSFLFLKFSIFFSFLTIFQFTFFSANNHIFYSTRQTSIEKNDFWPITPFVNQFFRFSLTWRGFEPGKSPNFDFLTKEAPFFNPVFS